MQALLAGGLVASWTNGARSSFLCSFEWLFTVLTCSCELF